MNSKIIKWLLGSLITASLCGCTSPTVRTAGYMESYPPATDPGSIKIFHQKPADREFSELTEITVDMASEWKQVERIFRSKAAEFGADAVYVLKEEEYTREVRRPHDCHFYYEPGYPYGYHYDPFYYGYFGSRPFSYRYPHRYYYCYGSEYVTEKTSFMKVIGIAIKFKSAEQEGQPEAAKEQ